MAVALAPLRYTNTSAVKGETLTGIRLVALSGRLEPRALP